MKDNITEESYYRLIEAVVAKYASVKNASSEELNTLEKELKSHWKNIKKHLNFKPVVKKPKSRKNKKSGTVKN